ncbi:MAG TPA: hypothetical protein VFE46_07750 [Pirellulales bacterium]|jgi:hypothetical protein|nr:hypothetical protein [Pirellulales bacterium]
METVPTYPISEAELRSRQLFTQLQAGDCLEAKHEVKVGLQRWTAKTVGTVVRCERRQHGLHFRRHVDDKVYSDIIVLKREDGELTTVTLDEYTVLRRL